MNRQVLDGNTIIQSEVQFNKIFEEFNRTTVRYRLARGSAGSGKSVNIANDFIYKLSDTFYRGANLLVVRKTDSTNRDSTFSELLSAINRMFGRYASSVWKVWTNPLMFECQITGSRIIFRGMNDQRQREKTKSITFPHGKLTWIWLEEATEFLPEDVEILDDRLRGNLNDINPNLFYQITFSFNPVSAQHWIKQRYFDACDDMIYTHHSTYLQNRFIDENYHKRMMRRKELDPEGYKVYGLGEWGELGGLILTNYKITEISQRDENYDATYYGQDFGFNHANAILDVSFKDGNIYIKRELYLHERDSQEIIDIAKRDGYFRRDVEMFCDSAEPDRIKMWKKAGYWAKPVSKEKGSVNAQIDFLKSRKIYIHPSCVNTIKEIQQWKWKKDEKTGEYIDQPVEIFDDAMASLRYAVERQRRAGEGITFLE